VGKTSLRLMFMNAENLFTPEQSFYGSRYNQKEYDLKIDWISSMIVDQHVHVCALSEIGEDPSQCLNDIMAAVNTKEAQKPTGWPSFSHKKAFNPGASGTKIRVAIISRYPISNSESLTKYPDGFQVDMLKPGSDSSVPANWVTVPSHVYSRPIGKATITPTDKTPFNLFVVHLKSKRPKTSSHDNFNPAIGMARSAIQRNIEAAALRYYLDWFLPKQYNANPKIPTILVGDFNDVPNSVPLENIRGPFDKKLGPSKKWTNKDKLRLISGGRLHLKKVAYEDKLFSYVHEEHFSLIDQAFVSQHLVNKFVRMEIYNDHVFRHQALKTGSQPAIAQQWKTTVSDHGVVLIELTRML